MFNQSENHVLQFYKFVLNLRDYFFNLCKQKPSILNLIICQECAMSKNAVQKN